QIYTLSLHDALPISVVGVGFFNFNNYVVGEPRYSAAYEGVSSVDWPHSNLAAVLAETGVLGFLPYVMMHFLLLAAMWRLRKVSGRSEEHTPELQSPCNLVCR